MNCAAFIDGGQDNRKLSYKTFHARYGTQMHKWLVCLYEQVVSLPVVIAPRETRRSSGEIPIGEQPVRIRHKPFAHGYAPAVEEYFL